MSYLKHLALLWRIHTHHYFTYPDVYFRVFGVIPAVIFFPLYLFYPLFKLVHRYGLDVNLKLRAFFGSIGAAFLWLWMLGGVAIHIWTGLIAYRISGIAASLISLFTPSLSEMFWFIRLHGNHSYYYRALCLWLISYVLTIACFLFAPTWMFKDLERTQIR
jgi:hypothetical protein